MLGDLQLAIDGAMNAALLVVSAHWEERVPTLMTSSRPPMLYDYYGFPPEAYQITWPAPGDRPTSSPSWTGRWRALRRARGRRGAAAADGVVKSAGVVDHGEHQLERGAG